MIISGYVASGNAPMAGMGGVTDGQGVGVAPPVDAHTLLTQWQAGVFSIAVAVVLLGVAVWYLRAIRRLAGRGRRWAPRRIVSFLAGLVAVELALGSSVAVQANFTFTAHVIQHLLLMVVGPPLLALGAPMTLALQTSPRVAKVRLLKVLHSRPFAGLTHPVPVFALYYLSMYAFFLTGALGYAMDHPWLMDTINLGFLGGATLFWWPMVGQDPIPRWNMNPGFKMINLLVGIPIESFLGIALLMKATPVAAMYSLASTHTGGGVLWAASEFATIVALAPIFGQWSRADARAAKRIDARLDAGETIGAPVFEGHGIGATLKALRRD